MFHHCEISETRNVTYITMLHFLDAMLTVVHLVIIIFNLTGWMFSRTRKLHLISIIITAGSWFILGIWYGTGYCPVTDWQWRVKEKLGETDLPGSFITYFVNRISGKTFSDQFINIMTLVFFVAAAFLSIYVNFIKKKSRNKFS